MAKYAKPFEHWNRKALDKIRRLEKAPPSEAQAVNLERWKYLHTMINRPIRTSLGIFVPPGIVAMPPVIEE